MASSKKVCFRTFANEEDLTEWYTFDAMETGFDYEYSSKAVPQGYCDRCLHGNLYCHHHSGSEDARLDLRPVVSCRMSRVESWAVLPGDSNLYCVGCYEAPSAERGQELKSIWDDVGKPKNKVFFFNSDQATTRSDDPYAIWTAGSDMLSCRKEPHVLVLDGRLFVIGGVYHDHDDVSDGEGDDDEDDDDEKDEEEKDDYHSGYPAEFQTLGEKHDEEEPETSSSRAMDSKVCQDEEMTPKLQARQDLLHPSAFAGNKLLISEPQTLRDFHGSKSYGLLSIIAPGGEYGINVVMEKCMEPKYSKTCAFLVSLGPYVFFNARERKKKSQLQRKVARHSLLDHLPLGLKQIGRDNSDLHGEKQQPWAEVYNTDNGQWKRLPDPPSLPHEGYGSGFICAAIEVDRMIVVGSAKENILYSYSLDTCTWTPLKGHQLNPSCSGKAVVVHRTLYWFTTPGFLMAYDLEKKTWYQGTVDDQWDQSILGTYVFNPGLVHLESNLFGLIWADTEISGTIGQSLSQRSHLHCLKFQIVSRTTEDPGKGFLNVSIKSCYSRPIDHGITFVDCVAL